MSDSWEFDRPGRFTVGTIGFDDATIEANADEWGGKGSLLGLLRGPLVWYLVIPGLLLLGLGAFLAFTGRPATEEPVYADEAAYDETPYEERYPDRTDQFFEEATASGTTTADAPATEPIETRRSRRDITE